MQATTKKIFRAVLWACAVLGVLAGAFLAHLVYIGEPSRASSLEFQGFVLLPRSTMLTVLDYLTVSDKHLFVTDESGGNVYKIALRTNSLPSDADVSIFASEPAAHGVAIDPGSGLAYVTRSEANTVDIFDPETMNSIKRIAVADDADAILFDSFHDVVYVANGDPRHATLISPQTSEMIGVIPLGGKPEFAVLDAQTKLLYQNLRDINAVVEIDLAKRSVVQGWTLSGCVAPSGMAIDEVGRRLFIACSGNAMLAIFDLKEHRVTSSIPIGAGPDSVAFDPALHRIYTTGRAGVLAVIHQETPDVYHVLDSIKLHYGAHTLTVDPRTHALYVAYASLLVRPRIAVFAPRP
jgi:DNA-binding beta-propeller fold protein YncE